MTEVTEAVVEFVVLESEEGFRAAWRVEGGPIMGQSAPMPDRDFALLFCQQMGEMARRLGGRDLNLADIVPGLYGLKSVQ